MSSRTSRAPRARRQVRAALLGVGALLAVPLLAAGIHGTAEAATPSGPSTSGSPAFTDYAAPAGINGANDAGEPSIGNNWKTGATMYQAGLATLKVDFDDSTTPATATWTDRSASLATGCPQGSTVSLDPILYTDSTTGRTFESQLTGQDSFTCYTDDDGASWLPSTGGGIPSGVDHQTLGGGPYPASGLGPLPTALGYPDAVYYCSQDIVTAFCALSRDGGTTFGAGVPTYSLADCGGLHGHVKVGPDGTAYLPNASCNGQQAVVTSTDEGTTWTVHPVPDSTSGDGDPSVATGSDGTLYFGYVGADGQPAVAVSHDRGTTFAPSVKTASAQGIQNAVFPTVVAGDGDRAAFAFLGTTTGGNYQDAANFKGVWYLYVSMTYDGGKTWTTVNATPGDPVQRGSICTGGTTCGNDRNLLDFIDITKDATGRVLVGFADGCIDACVSGGPNSFSAYATVARQSSGPTLFSAYDTAAPSPTTTTSTATASPSPTATTSSSPSPTATLSPSPTTTTTTTTTKVGGKGGGTGGGKH